MFDYYKNSVLLDILSNATRHYKAGFLRGAAPLGEGVAEECVAG